MYRLDWFGHLNNCFGVSVAVSAWSAGVGQQRKGLQMEKTPRRQNAYSVNRMKMARGTREYITLRRRGD